MSDRKYRKLARRNAFRIHSYKNSKDDIDYLRKNQHHTYEIMESRTHGQIHDIITHMASMINMKTITIHKNARQRDVQEEDCRKLRESIRDMLIVLDKEKKEKARQRDVLGNECQKLRDSNRDTMDILDKEEKEKEMWKEGYQKLCETNCKLLDSATKNQKIIKALKCENNENKTENQRLRAEIARLRAEKFIAENLE